MASDSRSIGISSSKRTRQFLLSESYGTKTYNIAGSIFLDYRNAADFSDSKSIIYGHNMKDGSMFHILRNYRNIEFFQKYQEMEVYLPDGRVLNYEIAACEEVEADSDVYQITQESRESKKGNEIILSTCSSRK